jgi:DdrB-like protein
MTDEQFQILIETLLAQTALLERLAIAVEGNQPAPNYLVALSSFAQFDWSTIAATVESRDRDGAAVVTWHGNRYTRRSASNKFQPAIWFSRAIGKDDQGTTQYERLITFKESAVAEPLPDKVRQV